MGKSSQGKCALFITAAVAAMLLEAAAHAAPIPIYGGPTYSETTGGYLVTGAGIGTFILPGAFQLVRLSSAFGAVNDSGIAVGNFDRLLTPLTATPQNAPLVSVRWSASIAPAEIARTSSNAASQVRAINSAGTIAGIHGTAVVQTRSTGSVALSTTGAVYNAGRWPSPGATIQFLPDASGVTAAPAWGYAINNQGTILGNVPKFNSSGASNGGHAARWEPGATSATELGLLNPDPEAFGGAFGVSINSAGATVGYVTDNVNIYQPVRWDAGQTAATKLDNLGTPAGSFTDGAGMSINDAGVTVGYARKYSMAGANLGLRAVRWDAGGTAATELGTIANGTGVAQAAAIAMNNAGDAIGFADVQRTTFPNNFIVRGLRWDAGGTLATELRAIATDGQSTPMAISAQGIVVGSCDAPVPRSSITTEHAVYWGADTVPVDLNSLIDPASGWTLTKATDISDNGWIMGYGQFDPDGAGSVAPYQRMFLMQVPEPGSLVIAYLGLACLGLTQMRRFSSTEN